MGNFICGLAVGAVFGSLLFLCVDLATLKRLRQRAMDSERKWRLLFSEIHRQNLRKRFDFSHN